MTALKSILAIAVIAGAASAHATVFNVMGTLDSTQGGETYLQSSALFGGLVPPSSPSNSAIAVTGSIDIDGSTVNSLIITIANYGLYAIGGGSSATEDVIGSGYTFSASQFNYTPGVTNCTGSPLCPTSAGPQIYTLISRELLNTGINTYSLQVYTSHETDFSSRITSQNFTLQAVPLPTTAWLFGSALLGLAGTAKRRLSKT